MPLPTPHLIPIPPPALSPQTIHSTVRKILGLIPIYPTRFHDIEAAKTYISSICASKHILLPEHDKDKITFLVAVRAFEVGEFYLTTPLPDRQALRGAVETHIARILPCIQTWPRFFTSAIDAQRWITSVINVENLKFDGVEPDKFKGYVTYNAARKMWEEGKFELSGVPKGWVRKAPSPVSQKIVATSLRIPPAPPPSLSTAVQTDISRVAPLLPPWPPHFADLNAARDYVREVCYAIYFRYTYHTDVAGHKFRRFVHYNVAKEAWEAGAFEVGEEKRVDESKEGKVCNAETKRCPDGLVEEVEGSMFRVSKEAYDTEATQGVRSGLVMHRSQDVAASVVADVAAHSTLTLLPNARDSSKETSEGPEKVVEEDVIEEEVVKEKVDPFKALIADLRREFILKAAFE